MATEADVLEAAVEACPMGLVVADAHGRVTAVNAAARALLGEAAAPGASLEALADPPLREIPRQGALVRASATGRWLLRHEAPLPDGGRTWCLLAMDPPPRGGPPVWDAWTLAALDPRTGLPGERALRLAMGPQLARCARYRDPLSLAVLEVRVPGGDGTAQARAVRAAAQAVRGLLRWADLVGVSDAGEVLAVLPETAERDAGALVRRMCAEVRSAVGSDAGDAELRVGLAAWQAGDTPEALVGRARAALAPCPEDAGGAEGR